MMWALHPGLLGSQNCKKKQISFGEDKSIKKNRDTGCLRFEGSPDV